MTFSDIIWYMVLNTFVWLIIHVAVSKIFLTLSYSTLQWISRHFTIAVPLQKSLVRYFYESLLKIRKWKDKLPYGTQILGLGRSPLASYHRNKRSIFVLETVRAEWAHWTTIIMVPLFLLFNPPQWIWVHALYAILSNLPCIFIQRYNRFRINRKL